MRILDEFEDLELKDVARIPARDYCLFEKCEVKFPNDLVIDVRPSQVLDFTRQAMDLYLPERRRFLREDVTLIPQEGYTGELSPIDFSHMLPSATYSLGVSDDTNTKCLIANRFSLAGMLVGSISKPIYNLGDKLGENIVGKTVKFSSYPGLGCSGLFLFGTNFAEGTIRAYMRTKDHIQRRGELDRRFAKTFQEQGYCAKKGLELAAKEADINKPYY
jgi:hypothetical protein